MSKSGEQSRPSLADIRKQYERKTPPAPAFWDSKAKSIGACLLGYFLATAGLWFLLHFFWTWTCAVVVPWSTIVILAVLGISLALAYDVSTKNKHPLDEDGVYAVCIIAGIVSGLIMGFGYLHCAMRYDNYALGNTIFHAPLLTIQTMIILSALLANINYKIFTDKCAWYRNQIGTNHIRTKAENLYWMILIFQITIYIIVICSI